MSPLLLLTMSAMTDGHVSVPVIGLLMGGSAIAVLALMWAKRLWFFELVAVGLLFLLIGGSPIGRAIYEFLSSLG